MSLPDKASAAYDIEDVAPGVSRVRPAVFPALPAAVQGPSALRAYQPAAEPAASDDLPAASGADDRLVSLLGLGLGRRSRGTAPSRSAKAPRGGRGAGERTREDLRAAPRAAQATGEMEQRLAPLRGISRELVSRGMPAQLVAELLAEIVAEFGNQVLESERDARLALVEQLLLRLPSVPLATEDTAPAGTYLVTGPCGAGKSVLIAHLALMAAKQGQREVVLVNTQSTRLGAAAQMNALGTVFGYDVEHIYAPQELRKLRSHRGTKPLILVETAGWSLSADAETPQKPWAWQLPGARVVVCVPATGQADDLHALLTTTRHMTNGPVAVLSKTTETRNVLPALGALAQHRQPVGMVVPGPDLAADVATPSLGDIARAALGVVTPQRKKGRVS